MSVVGRALLRLSALILSETQPQLLKIFPIYKYQMEIKIQLKTNSKYYYQVQGQMAVTGRLYTDFVVFTCHGNLIQRIKFDSCFWEGMLNKLEWFWVNCLCPELLTKKIKQKQLPECTEIPTTVSPVARKDGNHESKSPVTTCDSSGFQITSRVRVSSHSVSLSAS